VEVTGHVKDGGERHVSDGGRQWITRTDANEKPPAPDVNKNPRLHQSPHLL
jgi:hypothetical protein